MRVPKACSWISILPALSAALLGCSGGPEKTYSDVTALYTIPSSLDELSERTFFDHPWPSDLRLENGSPRVAGYYNPKQIPIVTAYIDAIQGTLDGFSPAAAGYLRFTDAIDPASLPADPMASLLPTASVQLIDIDPSSPQRGQRKLLSVEWREKEGVYYLPNTLAFMPTVGFPLRPHTRYALVVTDSLRAKKGGAIAQSPTVSQLVGVNPAGDANIRRAYNSLSTAVDELIDVGIIRESIVHLAVYTTADPTAELLAVRDGVASTVSAPAAHPSDWQKQASNGDYDEYLGVYGPSPNYQAGNIPFQKIADGGAFQLQNGKPVLQSTFDPRFSLTVPNAGKCPMPAAGYPIVLYAHGTGGDFRSYVSDGTGHALAQHCLASMGIDQIFHGTRPGAPADGNENTIELLFYNFENPIAGRTNGRQAAIDEVQRARLFTETHLTVPASVSKTGSEIRFDGSKLMFFGHSQGGLNGPLFTAIDDSSLGGVFSGSGAAISIALLEKTSPEPSVASLVTLLLGLGPADQAEEDLFHPAISLIQSIIDVEDPLHYGRLQATEPRHGFAPKSIYMTEGVNPDGTGDTYAPPHGIEAHSLAIGLPVELPLQYPIKQTQWGGPGPVTIPPGGLSGNLGGGKASGVLGQWAVPPGSDGHFVVFDVKAAREQAAQFLQNLAASPKGLVPPP